MASPNIDQLRPLRRVEYDQLIALGHFQDERIELLDGALVRMSPIGPPHTATVTRLTELLVLTFVGKARVQVQGPFAASELSEPEPDVCVIPLGDYDSEHASRAYLIIEVAESSLSRDRARKARLYAGCNVPEYWIVNLVERAVEVLTEPVAGAYQRTKLFHKGERITLVEFPHVALAVDDFLR
jgi:Uma2 family endonuclease